MKTSRRPSKTAVVGPTQRGALIAQKKAAAKRLKSKIAFKPGTIPALRPTIPFEEEDIDPSYFPGALKQTSRRTHITNATLRRQVDRSRETAEALRFAIAHESQAKAYNETLIDNEKDLKEAIDEQKDDLSRLKDAYNKIVKKMDRARSAIDRQSTRAQRLESEAVELEELSRVLRASNLKYRKELKAANERYEQALAENEELEYMIGSAGIRKKGPIQLRTARFKKELAMIESK